MERWLLVLAMGLGLVAFVVGLVLQRRGGETGAATQTNGGGGFGPLSLMAFALSVVLFLLSLPAQKPFFAVGGGLGFGLLLGGLGAIVPFLALRGFRAETDLLRRVIVTMAFAPIVVGSALWFFRASLMDTLAGVALGWIAISILLALDNLRDVDDSDTTTSNVPMTLAIGAGYAVALCAVAAMGTFREGAMPMIARGSWSSFGLLTGALLPALSLVFLFRGVGAVFSGVFVMVFLMMQGWLSTRVAAGGDADNEIGTTIFGVAVLVALSAVLTRFATSSGRNNLLWSAMLLVVASVIAATQHAQGFGASLAGLMLFFPIPLFLTALKDPSFKAEEHNLSRNALRSYVLLVLFGVGLVLFRWTQARWADDLRAASLVDHYALFALLVGAFLPSLLAQVATNNGPIRADILSVLLGGAVAVGAPVALIILFGGKVALGLLMGLAVGVGFLVVSPALTERLKAIAALLALAVALIPLQLTGTLLPLADLPRGDRLKALALIAGIVGALIVAFELRNRQNTSANVATIPVLNDEEARR